MTPAPTPPYGLISFLLVLFLGYIYPSLCLYKIANKAKTEGGWLAWVPGANLVLLCRLGRVSPWWALATTVPFLGIIPMIALFYHMPKCLGVRRTGRILAAIPIVGFFYVGYLAFFFKPALDAEGRVAGVEPLRINTTQEIAAAALCMFLAILMLGLETAMAVPAFKKVRDTAREVAVQNNLRQLSCAADEYFIETGETLVRYGDLVGPDKPVKELKSVAGEDYQTVFRVISAGQTYYSILVPALDRRVSYSAAQNGGAPAPAR